MTSTSRPIYIEYYCHLCIPFIIERCLLLKMCLQQIVLQDIFDDPNMNNCAPEQLKKDVKSDYGTTFHEMEKDDNNPVSENKNHLPHGSSYHNKEMTRRSPLGKEKDESFPLHSESTFQHHQRSRTRSPVSQDEALEIHPGGRYMDKL